MSPTLARTIGPADSGGSNTNSVTTAAFTPAAYELLIFFGILDGSDRGYGGISDTSGLTWNLAVTAADGTSSNERVQIWTAKVGATSPGSITVTVTASGAAGFRTLSGSGWSQAALASTPATHTVIGSTTCSDTITATVVGSVIIWGAGDWNSKTGTPAYRSSATALATTQATYMGAYTAYQSVSATGAQTYGMTAPTGQKATMASIEIIPGTNIVTVAASISASMTVTAAAKAQVPVAANLSGGLTVSAAATAAVPVAASISGSLTVSAAASAKVPVASSITGALTVTAKAQGTYFAAASITGTLTVAALAAVPSYVSATINAALTVTTNAVRAVPVAASINGVFTLTVTDFVHYAYATGTATGRLHTVTTVHGRADAVANGTTGTILIKVAVARGNSAAAVAALSGTPRLRRVIQESNRAIPAQIVASIVYVGPLGRTRFISAAAAANTTLLATKLHLVVRMLQNFTNIRTAAGEKPSRVVITTCEGDAFTGVLMDTVVRTVQAYAEGDSSAVGNLINGAHYSPAVANATAVGNLRPVRHLDQILLIGTTATGRQHVAVYMTDVISVVSVGSLFPDDGTGGQLMGVKLHEPPADVSYAIDGDPEPSSTYDRTFMVMPK